MRSRLILGAVLAALCVAVLMVLRSRTRPPSPAPATTALQTATPSPQMTQQQLETDIIQHGVTPDRARMLFSMVVGRLPGVSVPATRDPGDFDGTLAITYLNQVWSSLTPEQQTAASALVAAPTAAPVNRHSTLPVCCPHPSFSLLPTRPHSTTPHWQKMPTASA